MFSQLASGGCGLKALGFQFFRSLAVFDARTWPRHLEGAVRLLALPLCEKVLFPRKLPHLVKVLPIHRMGHRPQDRPCATHVASRKLWRSVFFAVFAAAMAARGPDGTFSPPLCWWPRVFGVLPALILPLVVFFFLGG